MLIVGLLWVLTTIHSSVPKERKLLSKNRILVQPKELTVEDIEGLPENAPQELLVKIGDEEQSESLTQAKVLKHLKDGHTVTLVNELQAPRILDEASLETIRSNTRPDSTISVRQLGEKQDKYRKIEEIEKLVAEGRKFELASDIPADTWWHGVFLVVPGIEVDLTRGNIVLVVVFLLGALGIYKLFNRHKPADFLIETESELRRVDWPSKPEVLASTKVVITVVIILMIILAAFDLAYGLIVKRVFTILFGETGAKS